MRRNLLLFLLLTVASFAWAQEEKPLLTIGCISDFHNGSLLLEDPQNPQVRGSLQMACKAIHDNEDVDMILIGGDCSSDCTITLDVFNALKQLVRRTIASSFHDPDDTPVLFTAGNHDYDVADRDANGHRKYNAADYYTDYMAEDVGVLTDEDEFFEEGENNGGKMRMRAAFYYKVKGFDFISLNCGKHEFNNNGTYKYSSEAVNWVANKLEKIMQDDPNKTVFFFLHIPFGDSNSIRNEHHGIYYTPAEYKLKQTLAKYPNLIMLYGHDHGAERAYTRRSTAQRVTLYNTDGKVIPTFDATHVEGATTDPENDYNNLEHRLYLQNFENGQYLARDNSLGLAFNSGKRWPVTFVRNGVDNTFNLSFNEQSINYENSHYHEGIASPMALFKVDEIEGNKVTATRVETIEVGERYIIATLVNNAFYYAIGNVTHADDNRNLRAIRLRQSGNTVTYTGTTTQSAEGIVWYLRDDSSAKRYYIESSRTGKFLNGGDYNISTSPSFPVSTLRLLNDDPDDTRWDIECARAGTENEGGKHVRNGTGGNFALNPIGADFFLYKVENPESQNPTAHRVHEIEDGATYALVSQNMLDPTKYYMMTNRESNRRMTGVEVTPEETITFQNKDFERTWKLREVNNTTPSFFSAFMGSMRYFYTVADPGLMYHETPKIVQGLMVYVYPDRVVLQMKNYNLSGDFSSVRVNQDLATYTSYRTVRSVTDGIEGITTPRHLADPAAIYDLQGRRVEYPTHGIYIRDGKKIVVK